MMKTLKELRNEKRMTLAELSKKTHMSPGYLNHIENGIRMLTDDMIPKLSEGLDVPEWMIRDIAETMKKNEVLTRSWVANILINGLPLVEAFETYLLTESYTMTNEDDLRGSLMRFIENNFMFSVANELHTNKEFIAALGDRINKPNKKIEQLKIKGRTTSRHGR
jgi:transcriptional regulator with XRE-family HTH domain